MTILKQLSARKLNNQDVFPSRDLNSKLSATPEVKKQILLHAFSHFLSLVCTFLIFWLNGLYSFTWTTTNAKLALHWESIFSLILTLLKIKTYLCRVERSQSPKASCLVSSSMPQKMQFALAVADSVRMCMVWITFLIMRYTVYQVLMMAMTSVIPSTTEHSQISNDSLSVGDRYHLHYPVYQINVNVTLYHK